MSIRRRIGWLTLPLSWIRRDCFDWGAAVECWKIAIGLRPDMHSLAPPARQGEGGEG
jgi:hypothetical protein